MSGQKTKSLPQLGLSAILMFLIGFIGFSILGAIVLVAMITLGVLPAI